jgi:hypothetical protein
MSRDQVSVPHDERAAERIMASTGTHLRRGATVHRIVQCGVTSRTVVCPIHARQDEQAHMIRDQSRRRSGHLLRARSRPQTRTLLANPLARRHLPRGQRASELGALGGTRTPNLLIRSSMCGHPDRSDRSVTSDAFPPAVHTRPNSRKIVRPGGSQRGSQGCVFTAPEAGCPIWRI